MDSDGFGWISMGLKWICMGCDGDLIGISKVFHGIEGDMNWTNIYNLAHSRYLGAFNCS